MKSGRKFQFAIMRGLRLLHAKLDRTSVMGEEDTEMREVDLHFVAYVKNLSFHSSKLSNEGIYQAAEPSEVK